MTTSMIRITKNGKPDRRNVRRETHLNALEKLLKKPRSVNECAERLGVNVRAVYFLFAELNERGTTVARIGPKAGGKYTLLS